LHAAGRIDDIGRRGKAGVVAVGAQQAAVGFGADTLIVSPSNTFWGSEVGLDLLNGRGVTFGLRAFYEASADTQTVGGNAYLKIPLWDPVIGTRDSGIRITSANGSMPIKAPPLPTMWNWTGGYIGAHVGGALSTTDFSDPFGASAYGDTVRSPAFLGGGKIGYN
jgi:hypothetical protein